MSTADRLLAAGWWPTKGSEPRERYVGSAACATCHSRIAEMQKTTPMASASMPATAAAFARSGIIGPLAFSIRAYTYQLTQTATALVYSASDGAQSVSTPLGWVFGTGHFGQTYVYSQDGTYYESTLSYYPAIHGLDFTTGHSRTAPASLAKALGEPQSPDAIHACFGCHSSVSTTSNRFDPSRATPGVTCESCHGPGAQHVAAMTIANENQKASFAFNPASLNPADSVDFCGACHRTRVDVIQTGIRGIITVRFPAYRLQASRCWGSNGDSRVTCVACHDPHHALVTDAASYDKNCLSCHRLSAGSKLVKDHPGAACPVAQKGCVTCHMPKVYVPEMHADFTDHKIAVHRRGNPFKE
jgi:Cytochrome c554 and c-prime